MILATGAEVTWKQFIDLPQYKNLPLHEQVIAYDKYLTYLSNIRNSNINFQNKGPSRGVPESPGNPVACIAGMDVVFLLDYTGSMGTAINNVKTSIQSIVNKIISRSNRDYRLGLVLFDEYEPGVNPQINDTYGLSPFYVGLPAAQKYVNNNVVDNRDQYITAVELMSKKNITTFQSHLALLNTVDFPLGYGSYGPEPGGIGFEQVLNGIANNFRSNVVKLVIIITDNIPGGDDDLFDSDDTTFLQSLVPTAYNSNIQVAVMSSKAITANTEYRILSDNTNGNYINSFTPDAINTAIDNICDSNR